MVVKELNISGFKDELKNSKLNYPQSLNPNAPKFFFNLLSVASRGTGKTYNIVKLIKEYENGELIDDNGVKHPIRTFLISPTFEANPIYKNLKSLDESDIYNEYSDEILQDIMDDIKAIKEEIESFDEYKKWFEIVAKTDKDKIPNLIKKYPFILEVLERFNYESPTVIRQSLKYDTLPVNVLILDDCMGGEAFSKKNKNLLTYYLIKNRHHMVSFCMLVQNLKSIPKQLRSNCNLYFLGKFASKKVILDDMYEEVSNVLTPDEFEELYTHATEDKYGILIIDNTGSEKRFYRGFEKQLILEK